MGLNFSTELPTVQLASAHRRATYRLPEGSILIPWAGPGTRSTSSPRRAPSDVRHCTGPVASETYTSPGGVERRGAGGFWGTVGFWGALEL